MEKKKVGPKQRVHSVTVTIADIYLSEIEIARLSKILSPMLVNHEQEGANEGKPKSRSLLSRII